MPLSTSRYLRTLLLAASGLTVFVVAFNYVIDPYGIYHQPGSWDLVRSRPEMNVNLSLHKAYAV